MFPMKLLTPLALASALTATAAVGQAPATTQIKAADGKVLGEATFREGPSGVLLQVKIAGLTPGWHGMHFHAMGDCSDPVHEDVEPAEVSELVEKHEAELLVRKRFLPR